MASRERKTPGRMIQIPEDEWRALLSLASDRGTNASSIIRDAVRAVLIANDRLPKAPEPVLMGVVDIKPPRSPRKGAQK